MIDLYILSFDAPPGRIWLAGTRSGLIRVGFGGGPTFTIPGPLARHGLVTLHRHAGPLAETIRSLRAYLAGEIPTPQATLDLDAVRPFSHRVFDAVLRIPAGEVRSFDDVARTIGSPRAARAVGRALAANPVPLFVPCHRVVTKDGDLGGYLGGTQWKRTLLDLETNQIPLTPRLRRRRAPKKRDA